MASRIEPYGHADSISVSKGVHDALGDDYEFDEGRVIDVLGRGPVLVYQLLGRREQGDRVPLVPGPDDLS